LRPGNPLAEGLLARTDRTLYGETRAVARSNSPRRCIGKAIRCALQQSRVGERRFLRGSLRQSRRRGLHWELLLATQRVGDDLRAQGDLDGAAKAYQVWLEFSQLSKRNDPPACCETRDRIRLPAAS